MNQIQKNAKDINSRLEMIENTILFKQPPPKIGGMLPDAKVCQVAHTVPTFLIVLFVYQAINEVKSSKDKDD